MQGFKLQYIVLMANHFHEDEVQFYATADERIVEIQGETLKVLKALEAVVGHLRKFLVDHSVLPLFERNVRKFPYRICTEIVQLCYVFSFFSFVICFAFSILDVISPFSKSLLMMPFLVVFSFTMCWSQEIKY